MRVTKNHAIILGAGILAVMAVLILLRSHGSRTGAEPAEPSTVPARRIPVLEQEYPVHREITGRVVSKLETTLASRISGWVREVSVEEGDRVRAGRILVSLDEADLRAELQRAEARAENAARRLERFRELFRTGSATRQQLDDVEQDERVAVAETRNAEANLSYAEVRAPFDGMVTEKRIETGELVSPGVPLIRMEDDARLRLEALVPEGDIAALRVGQTVTVGIEALESGPLTGMVGQILPSAEAATHSFWVKVDLPKAEGLRSGMFGRLYFPAGIRRGILVPKTSVLEREGLARVFVVDPENIVRTRLVKPGLAVDQSVEILSGLSAGETILEVAAEGREGARVE